MPVVLHIIFNPVAGKGRARRALPVVEAFLEHHDLPYTLLTTRCAGHATALAGAAPPGATVVVVGGDGTVHEVVKGLLNGPEENPARGRTLAVLPVGSGDDFAFSVGIARNDLHGALQRILAGRTARVDIGVVDGEPFANSIGVGFDAEAAYRVRTSPKAFQGLAAYLYGVLTALGSLRPVAARVWVDGALVHDGPSLLVSLQNGPRGGGNFLFAPGASNHDGLLDVLVAGEFSRAGAVRMLPSLMKGAHLKHPRVSLHRGTSVRMEWAEPQRGHADGEPLGPRTTYTAELRPALLEVIA